jgi:NAD(P)-dependent dehydrogenase (short-subunit alcohol dehydrogenase family)
MTTTRSVLISGASSGIGKASALHLARRGFFVIAGVRREQDGQQLESSSQGRLFAISLDITDPASIARARNKVEELTRESGLLGLFNNAGIAVAGPVEHVSLDEWRRQFEVNVIGHVALTQALLPLIRRYVAAHGHGSGRIIFTGSISGRVTLPILGPYSASKHAIAAIAAALRQELRAQGILVSLLEPGAIQSEIWKKADDFIATVGPHDPARALYDRHVEAMIQQTHEGARSAIPAEHVARLVEECLTRPKPKIRTTVGRDAAIAALLRWLFGERLFYRMIAKAIKIP